MRKFIICIVTAVTLMTTSAYAGPGGAGHSHGPAIPVSETQAIANATKVVSTIVKEGKLDASWGEVKDAKVEKKKNQYGQEWVVSFNNPKESDTEKKTLYVFLTLDGQYLGANHSGS